jgi:hypothetical protein
MNTSTPEVNKTTSTILPIIKSVLTNWVTSTIGTGVGSPALLDIINSIGTATGPNWKQDIGPLAIMLLGLAAKDGWITGGTTPATPEAPKAGRQVTTPNESIHQLMRDPSLPASL